ncbi:MAG: ABC transporter permease [Gammaproteobacteria bacterium]|jgi:ABC-2 type transport system permease protein|nr:ABC transporter permease [Gammaproteobacteria bacterium]|tara:strand:- start:3154 stop:3888 length:735 start_codon:yes stop_codon:yes gene_type:complete
MQNINIVLKREFASYFATPIAYVFIFIFLILSGVFTFYLGNFYERQQADLSPFFNFHPWLYLFLVPAVSMRLWSEERKLGTIELLMTLPMKKYDAIVGKFLAAWFFTGIALLFTFPLWITVNYLGEPDNGVILASYLGSWLMAGGFLAIGSCASALSKSQVIAFIICGVVCLLFIMAGFPLVLNAFNDWLPTMLVDTIASLSFLTHFTSVSKGVLSLRDMFYFISMIVFWLVSTAVVLEFKQAD